MVPLTIGKAVALAVGLGLLTYYLNIDRGWSYLWLFFAALVVVMDFALRRTTWGRHLFAVGGNEEAARRSGIKVARIYLSAFVLCSTMAALGGILVAAQVTSVSQSSGTTDTNLTAIAAAVIGGTSLFGGRGSAYSAMLGILVLQAIHVGSEPDRRGLVGPLHGDRRRPAAGGCDRLDLPTGPVLQRARLTSPLGGSEILRLPFLGRGTGTPWPGWRDPGPGSGCLPGRA